MKQVSIKKRTIIILLAISLIANVVFAVLLFAPKQKPEWLAPKLSEEAAAKEGYKPEYMRMALDIAYENVASGNGGAVAAVIVKDGVVIATASNEIHTSRHFFDHAEICAMRNAEDVLGKVYLKDCEIYTTAQPCLMCESAIYWARIGKIYYAASVEQTSTIPEFDDLFEYEQIQAGKNLVPSVGVTVDGEMDALNLWAESRK